MPLTRGSRRQRFRIWQSLNFIVGRSPAFGGAGCFGKLVRLCSTK